MTARFLAACVGPGLTLALLASGSPGQQPLRPELVIATNTPVIDGDLSDWPPDAASTKLELPTQLIEGEQVWAGVNDASAQFLLACDTNHLYLAGIVRDDQILTGSNLVRLDATDRIEIWIGAADDGEANTGEQPQLYLTPLRPQRPWSWADGAKGGQRQTGAQLTGVRVVGRRLDAVSYQFEAALPFHHVPSLRPGADRLRFDLVLRDTDEGDGGRSSVLSWTARDPAAADGLGEVRLPPPGCLVAPSRHQSLLSNEALEDLPYLLVPLATLLGLVLVLRGWSRLQRRAKWVRPALLVGGVVLVLVGLALPSRLAMWRDAAQRRQLDDALATMQGTLGKLEQGTLASYRGASRDRALVDLLSGKAIARQRYTSYRSLARLAPDRFGPAPRDFDGLQIRPYWLPLEPDRAETFQFDPPLQGTRVHLVVGRPFLPSFSLAPGRLQAPRLRLEIDGGSGSRQVLDIDLDRPFADGTSLGRDFWEVCVVPFSFAGDLRTLTVTAERGLDLRLVGLSLEGSHLGEIEPLSLGVPSLGGVLTDLRGPFPEDAGIELAPGATAKVAIPRLDEPAQKMWMFYRAVYPGLPAANPGARVAEVLLHFTGDTPKRTIVLEHQISMFYELAVHNTRDAPPEGSPASIAQHWIDEAQEKHQNLVYPVLDLPADAALEAIEFRNLSSYRIRFRSVVFGNERAAAPQDPVDTPLERDGQEWRLRGDVLGQLQGHAITVYRGGRLSETTLPPEQQQDAKVMSRSVTGAQVASTEELLPDGSRRVVVYAPLGGDGWDGAVLAMTSLHRDWARDCRTDSRLGLLLCLLGAPFVLVLLSELLAVATNLRLRLMAVMSVAALAPLGLLSLVLVQVLEGGHAKDVRESMLATIGSATQQLDDQKERLRGSARQWLRDLAAVVDDRIDKKAEPPAGRVLEAVGQDLQRLLAGQLPPEWGGGFLRLEWQPAAGKAHGDPLVAVAGDALMANVETPARLEPGVFMQWGVLLLGVRAEETARAGTLTLTAGRPLDGPLLAALAPGHVVMLTDVRGYPVAVSGGHADSQTLFSEAMDPRVMSQRERALATGLEQRQPTVEQLTSPAGNFVFGSEVMRDLQDTPRGLLVIAQPDQRATLDLATGRIPVRAFFLLVAGCLVVLAAFLSFVVSGRISRPIEHLERGAQALSRGALETRVDVEEGGQIGRLTRTFNQMATLLQARLQDLQALNRTMGELSAETDEATTLDVLRRFCASNTAADVMRVVLADPLGRGLVVHPVGEGGGPLLPNSSLPLGRLAGAFSMTAHWSSARAPGEATTTRGGAAPEIWTQTLVGCRSAIGLPIAFGGRVRGVVLLAFERSEPLLVDLELLSTVVAQAAAAFERSQLHRLAVQDPVTGAFTVDYFRGRVVDEVSLAQQRDKPLSMLAIAFGDGDRRPRGLRRFATVLRETLPQDAVLCHVGAGQFHIALAGVERPTAEALLASIRTAWADLVRQLPENEVEEQAPKGVVVQFPAEAPSAEFLFEALRARLLALHTPGASAMESDESLQRAGVTAVSPAMRAVYGALRRIAPTDLPILVEGETGVGKEVLTNLVHRWSRRAGGPLIKVHCAALSETLLASELFGHEKGAFTGAERRKIGRFEQADGGTIFLDEVGDIPLDVQVKLLRVLQEGEVDRVGGTETVKVDVRVIAATNRDIARMVSEGRFREDLYYRLQGMVVHVPPLRERKQELGELVEHFRREVVASGQSQAKTLSTDAMDELYRQDWPGNVRELRNTVFRAMIMAVGGVVHARDVLAALSKPSGGLEPTSPAASVATGPDPVATAAGVRATGRAGVTERGEPGEPATPEPTFVLPQAEPAGPEPEPTFTLATLPHRLRTLLDLVVSRGAYSTQDHMAAAGVSHRTSLRDLQALVRAGLVERVGSRRGTFYRPRPPHGRLPSAGGGIGRSS